MSRQFLNPVALALLLINCSPARFQLALKCKNLEERFVYGLDCFNCDPPFPTWCEVTRATLDIYDCRRPCGTWSATEGGECVDAAGDACEELPGLCPHSQKCCAAGFTCDVTQRGVTCEDATTCPVYVGQIQNVTATCPGDDVCCVRRCPVGFGRTSCQPTTCTADGELEKDFACPNPDEVCCTELLPV